MKPRFTLFNNLHLLLATMLMLVLSAVLVACGGTDATSTSVPATAAIATPAVAATTAAVDVAPTAAVATTAPVAAATDTSTGTGTGSTDTSATGTPAAGQSGSTTQVTGTLKEWAIDLSQKEVPAGAVHFTVTNAGNFQHNFTITDSSGTVAKTPNFTTSAGAQSLDVTLKPGTYTIICSLPGHAAKGQKTEIVVK